MRTDEDTGERLARIEEKTAVLESVVQRIGEVITLQADMRHISKMMDEFAAEQRAMRQSLGMLPCQTHTDDIKAWSEYSKELSNRQQRQLVVQPSLMITAMGLLVILWKFLFAQ